MGRETPLPLYGETPDFRLGLVETTGFGFALGAALGSAFHFQRGFRRSLNSDGAIAASAHAARANALRVAGSIASFNAVMFASERAVSLARRKEDPWNSIAGAAATCGIRRMRHGPVDAALHALCGAFAMALVHGAGISLDRVIAPGWKEEEDDLGHEVPVDHRPSP